MNRVRTIRDEVFDVVGIIVIVDFEQSESASKSCCGLHLDLVSFFQELITFSLRESEAA